MMGLILLVVLHLVIMLVPSSFAEEESFCDAKPLGKYCLPDNSGWKECLIDSLDQPAEEIHKCPPGLKCFCKPEQGLCSTHKNNPCSRSIEEPQRPEFPQSYFGVIFVTDAFCDKDGCEGRIVVSEKYRDDKNGGRSREDLVMGLTQHMTVIIVPEESKWAQYAIDLKEGGPLCNKTILPEFRGLTKVPDNFRFNGTVEILGVPCEDWIYEANSQSNFSAVRDKTQSFGVSQTARDKILTRLTEDLAVRQGENGAGPITEVHHIYVAKINGTNVPLKVEFAISIPNQNIFTHYKEFMVAYYPNKSISINSESRMFVIPDACSNQAGDDVTPVDIHTIKRQKNHHPEEEIYDGDDYMESKRFVVPSVRSAMVHSSDLLEQYRIAGRAMKEAKRFY